MAAGNQWKHLEFTLALLKLENIRMGTPLNILVTLIRKHKADRYFRARNILPRNNAEVTHCG